MGQEINVFLAGIIQGSLPNTIHNQDYRTQIGTLVKEHLPEANVYDPFKEHPDSLNYDPERGRDVFFDLMDRAGQTDILIAFVPQASMGTAIELWNAYHAGAVVIAVSELEENWVVRFLADAIVPDIEALCAFLKEGKLEQLLEQKVGYESSDE